MNAHLKSGVVEFSATDWLHPTRAPHQGNTTAIYLSSTDFSELKTIFDKLSDGAPKEFFIDLRDMPFGAYGRMIDRYGIEWFFRSEKTAR